MASRETLWDGDEDEFDNPVPTTYPKTDREVDVEMLGTPDDEIKWQTVRFPLKGVFAAEDLKGKTDVVFSRKNKGIGEPTGGSRRDFEAGHADAPYKLVKSVTLNWFQTPVKEPVTVTFEGIKAPKRFLAANGTSQDVSCTALNSAVPQVAFDRGEPDELVKEHVLKHPGLTGETVRKGIMRLNQLNETWLRQESAILSALPPDVFAAVHLNERGFHVHEGDHAVIEEAAKKVEELNDEYVAYSNLSDLAVKIRPPDQPYYNPSTDQFETKIGNWSSVVGAGVVDKAAVRGRLDKIAKTNDTVTLASAKREVTNAERALLATRSNSTYSFAAELEITYANLPPKFE